MNVVLIQENHATPAVNAPVAVVQAVNGRVKLVVASHGHQKQLTGREIMLRNRVDFELRFASRRGKMTLPWAVRQVKAAGDADASVYSPQIRG